MIDRYHMRRHVLRIGSTLCVLVTLLFLISAWWLVGVQIPNGPFVAVMSGALVIGLEDLGTSWLIAEAHDQGLVLLNQNSRWVHFVVPLPVCLVLIGLPTFAFCWATPRHPRGSCKCGYYLLGNVSGTCPECGRSI